MRFNPVSLVPAWHLACSGSSVNAGLRGRVVEWMDAVRWSGGSWKYSGGRAARLESLAEDKRKWS